MPSGRWCWRFGRLRKLPTSESCLRHLALGPRGFVILLPEGFEMGAASLAILIVVISVSFASGGVLLGRRVLHRHVAAFHNEVVISLFATASVVYAVLLGFLVVVVWEGYDSAHRNVAEEAASLVPLYRLTYGMQGPHGRASRALIREYADAVVNDEWPTMGEANAGNM